MSRRQAMTVCSVFAAALSICSLRVAANMVAIISALYPELSSRNGRQQLPRLIGELAEPLGEVRLAFLRCECARLLRHLDELLRELAQIGRGAEEEERRGLLLDRFEGLQSLRV